MVFFECTHPISLEFLFIFLKIECKHKNSFIMIMSHDTRSTTHYTITHFSYFLFRAVLRILFFLGRRSVGFCSFFCSIFFSLSLDIALTPKFYTIYRVTYLKIYTMLHDHSPQIPVCMCVRTESISKSKRKHVKSEHTHTQVFSSAWEIYEMILGSEKAIYD